MKSLVAHQEGTTPGQVPSVLGDPVMSAFAIIASLTSSMLTDSVGPSDLGGVSHPLGADRTELEAAVSWFLSEVADPILKAREPSELRRLMTERAMVAVEARGAIASAMAAWLKFEGHASLEPDAELRRKLLTKNPALLRLLEVTFADTRDLFSVVARRRLSVTEMTEAMRALTPTATDADVLLMLALVATVRDDIAPEIEHAVFELASANVLRHRARLHSLLRRWDPSWIPTIDAPSWADDPARVDLAPEEIEVIAGMFRNPPAPNAALRRALARS